jgi:hypothetical protein
VRQAHDTGVLEEASQQDHRVTRAMGLQEWEANVKVKTQQPPSQHPSSNKKMSDQTGIAFQLPPIPEATVVPGPPQASGSGSSHPAPAAKNTDHKTKRKPPVMFFSPSDDIHTRLNLHSIFFYRKRRKRPPRRRSAKASASLSSMEVGN